LWRWRATGGFETLAVAELSAAGLPVVVINPAQVRAFANAMGRRAKTDPIDAEVIAAFAAAMRPPVRPLPDAQTRLLADLVARRRQIIAMIVAEQSRARMAKVNQTQKSIKRILAALERELTGIDEELDGHIRKSPNSPAISGKWRGAPPTGAVLGFLSRSASGIANRVTIIISLKSSL
jgi:transposase